MYLKPIQAGAIVRIDYSNSVLVWNTQRLECPTLNFLQGIHDNNASNTQRRNTQQWNAQRPNTQQ